MFCEPITFALDQCFLSIDILPISATRLQEQPIETSQELPASVESFVYSMETVDLPPSHPPTFLVSDGNGRAE